MASIDIQVYNKGKEVRHRSNLCWDDAFDWLDHTVERVKAFECIDIQVATMEGMPVDDCHVWSFVEARSWLTDVYNKAVAGGYPNVVMWT